MGLIAELGFCSLDFQHQLLQTARQVDRRSLVAEVALELAEDGRHGKRRESNPKIGIEAVYGLDQGETCDLKQVVERLRRTRVAAGKLAGQREMPANQLIAGVPVVI